ncbi:acyl transferase/acyl hydrolase/lysophospholipase [Spinellus fusiger]|nr:acyl transferase/acyl hydrolase/lysophospholipase [Spinellus fusiger]
MIQHLVTATEAHESGQLLTKEEIAKAVHCTVTPVMNATKSMSLKSHWEWSNILYNKFRGSAYDQKTHYMSQLETATHYEEWVEAATMLDELEGLETWKRDPQSPDYDWELVKARLEQLRYIRNSGQGQASMIFALRTSLARNLGDMGKASLYARTRVGTKHLISDYITEVVDQLNWLCDEPAEDPDLDLKAKHDFFMNIRQSFGRTALLLSGGGTLGTNHLGVMKCLHSARLLPRIISGASSGSFMASFICTRTDEEITELFDKLSSVNMNFFEKEEKPETPWMRIHRLLTSGQLYDIDILTDSLRENLGNLTFQEAFNRTRWILNITVSSSTNYDMPQLLNYLTAPDVVIWSAVTVSCSVPFFYASSPLYAKDKSGKIVLWNPIDQLYIDGSVENDLPMTRLSELFNVNHFIVCQVNPHVIPFLQKDNKPPSKLRQVANFCMHLAKTEVQHRCTQLRELGLMPHSLYKIQAVMSQKYSGDITIIPDICYSDYLSILSNPTLEMVSEAVERGERATWPKMSIIRHHLQIELTIDAILYRLRLRRLPELAGASKEKHSPHQPVRSTSTRPLLETRALTQLKLHMMEAASSPTRAKHSVDTLYASSDAGREVSRVPGTIATSPRSMDLEKKHPEESVGAMSMQQARERKAAKHGLLMTTPNE